MFHSRCPAGKTDRFHGAGLELTSAAQSSTSFRGALPRTVYHDFGLSAGESGSNARRIARQTSRILRSDSRRVSGSINRTFGRSCIRSPRRCDGPGSPVSPASNGIAVGMDTALLPNGTMSTVSMNRLRLRASTETTTAQCRRGGSPKFTIQISPRLAIASVIKVHLADALGEGLFQFLVLRRLLG